MENGQREQGVAQGCSLSPISVFINGLLSEVVNAGIREVTETLGWV